MMLSIDPGSKFTHGPGHIFALVEVDVDALQLKVFEILISAPTLRKLYFHYLSH